MVSIQGGAGFTLFDAKRHEEVMTVLYNTMTEIRRDTVKERAVIGRTKTCYNIVTKNLVDASRDSACSIRNKSMVAGGGLIKKEHVAVYLPTM